MEKFFRAYHVVSLSVLLSSSLNASASVYVVKKGDKLCDIARTHIPGRVWGKDGSLQKVLNLNPWIRNPNLIYPQDNVAIGEIVLVEGSVINLSENETHTDLSEPLIASEPLKEDESTQSNLFQRTHSISIVPSLQITTLFVQDHANLLRAHITSKTHFKFEGRYSQHWSEKFYSFVGISLGYFNAEQPSETSKSVVSPSLFTSGMYVGGSTTLSNDTALEAYVAYQNELFLSSLSETSIKVDSLAIPSVAGRLTHDLLKRSTLTLGATGGVTVNLPVPSDGYSARLGYTYSAGLYLKQDTQARNQLKTMLGYYQRQQNTSLGRQSETGLGLSVQIPLGETDTGSKSNEAR